MHVLCSGVAQGDTVLELGHGEHMALAVQEGQSGTGDLGGRFFCGAMRAAYECSFPFWCSGAVALQEAEEVTFWPPCCLSYLSGATETLSQCLCIQGWVLPSAEHTQPHEHPLIPPGSGQTGSPGSVCT